MPDLKPEDVLDDETALSVQVREAENKLVEARAMLEAVEAALEGKPVSDFMSSFPVVMKAQALFTESKQRSGLVVDTLPYFTDIGRFERTVVTVDGKVVGEGLSRDPKRSLAFALEDLAKKVLNP